MGERQLALGRFGEEYAARWLVHQGAEIVCRNWRCETGEIDIVASCADLDLACEVKTRRGVAHGHPSEAVDRRRLARLRQSADQWLAVQRRSAVRVDAISITISAVEIQLQHAEAVTW